MYGSLDISTGGMIAQRIRLDTISANIANQNTLRDAQGNLSPFRRRIAVLASGDPNAGNAFAREHGVHVKTIDIDPTPAQPRVLNPTHPDAFKDGPFRGYIAETNINSVIENMNALEATRAYEANVVAAEAAKNMMQSALRLLA